MTESTPPTLPPAKPLLVAGWFGDFMVGTAVVAMIGCPVVYLFSHRRWPDGSEAFDLATMVVIGAANLYIIIWGRRTAIRRSRRDDGRCERCGYDLRGSTGRCPECGQAIT